MHTSCPSVPWLGLMQNYYKDGSSCGILISYIIQCVRVRHEGEIERGLVVGEERESEMVQGLV